MDEAKRKAQVGIVAKEANAKLQHYVPQYYLRGFLGDKDMLYVVDRPRDRFFRVITKKVGGEQYFNLIGTKGINPFAVEEALNELETKVAPVLVKVIANQSLGDENDRNAILNLVAAVTMRNPKQREAVNEIYRSAGHLAAGAGLETEERYAEFVAAMKAQGKTAPAYEEMKEWFKAEPEMFVPPPPPKEFNILIELQSHEPLVKLYESRKWQMLIASHDSGGFVTSDHPVCLRWSDGKDHGIVSPGFGGSGTEVIFPLSPKLALRGRFEGKEEVVQLDAEAVAGINSLLISNMHDQLFARDALFCYKRGPKGEIGSGSTLLQDEKFVAAGRRPNKGRSWRYGSNSGHSASS